MALTILGSQGTPVLASALLMALFVGSKEILRLPMLILGKYISRLRHRRRPGAGTNMHWHAGSTVKPEDGLVAGHSVTLTGRDGTCSPGTLGIPATRGIAAARAAGKLMEKDST